MNKIAIIGYGRMGQRYEKALNKLNINHYHIFDKNEYYEVKNGGTIKSKLDNDPKVLFSMIDNDLTHIFLCSPTETHDAFLLELQQVFPKAKILCEKPVVLYRNTIPYINPTRVFPSSVFRFNTNINNIVYKDFNKVHCEILVDNLAGEPLFDLAVHFVDLFLHLNLDYNVEYCNNYSVKLASYLYTADKVTEFSIECGKSLIGRKPRSRITLYTSEDQCVVYTKDNGESLLRQTESFLKNDFSIVANSMMTYDTLFSIKEQVN